MLLEKEPSRVESSSGKGDARNETLSAKGHEKTSASPANRNSPKKQAQLGQLLTRRKVTPVRTSGYNTHRYLYVDFVVIEYKLYKEH